ncbi:MAG: efflux RND transporter periplasmic adaptor subunit [Candidatus Cloacimonetes bacterium]|nr:efflux RND transporter periplasmic adaptor subunit [Candidatus Cloacimonadota bacterium]
MQYKNTNNNSISQSMVLRRLAVLIMVITCLIVISCGKKDGEKPANMNELHVAQGVPVKAQKLAEATFIKEITYNVTVSGLREAQVNSFVSDVVKSVNAKIGDNVSQNQIIIDFPQDNIQANYYQAEAAFNLANQTWERMQSLYATGGTSKQDLDGAETQFKVAQANWEAVQQTVHVRAPISGQITDINVRENQKIAPGDYLFTVSQLSKLYGRVWVSEDDIANIKRNTEVIFFWNDIKKTARIANIALSLNRDNNAFAVDIEIDNADYSIRSGITGKAEFISYRNDKAFVIPRNVIQKSTDGRDFVYVVQNNASTRKYVKQGQMQGLDVEIIEGLDAGDLVIISGYQLVHDNSKVNIQ